MIFYRLAAATLGLLCFGMAGSAQAVILYDQNVTNNVIFGSGNDNGHFTVSRDSTIELGLRAKLRFDASDQPQNIFNSNGDGTYTFQAGTPTSGFGPATVNATPVWNFEWSINTNTDPSTTWNLNDLAYQLSIDFDPSAAVNATTFDPINVPYADHAIGDNGTGNGAGTVATDAANYDDLISHNNLAQNSWNYVFFNGDALFGLFDPSLPGVYTITLAALDGNDLLSQVSIDVIVTAVPEPASVALMLAGLGGLGFFAWRRRRALAA